mgnify:FL=1
MWIITVPISVVFGATLEYIVSVNGSSTCDEKVTAQLEVLGAATVLSLIIFPLIGAAINRILAYQAPTLTATLAPINQVTQIHAEKGMMTSFYIGIGGCPLLSIIWATGLGLVNWVVVNGESCVKDKELLWIAVGFAPTRVLIVTAG